MTSPAAASKETTAASSSPTSPDPSQSEGIRPGLTLGVRQTTPSTQGETGPAYATDGVSAGGPPPFDPLDDPSNIHSGFEPREDVAPLKLGKDELRETARGLVLAGALTLHQLLARHPYEQDARLWQMSDEQEAAGIADPLASIARRYAGGALVDVTTTDLIKAGLAAAGYVTKNGVKAIQIRLAIRRARRAGQYVENNEE